MDHKKSKKGFTLIEMAIAIVVMAVVFGMVTLMSVSISGFSKEKTHITDCHEEIARAQRFINSWSKSLDDAFNTNFSVSPNGRQLHVQSGLYWFTNPDETFSLTFDPSTRTLTGEFFINGELVSKSETFRKLSAVTFSQGDANSAIRNTVKCELTLSDQSVYTMLLEKESSKPGLSVIFSEPFERRDGSDNEFIFITSADWDKSLNQTSYEDLQDVTQLAAHDFSAAYQYSALSMLRVQVDYQNRMSLEAFTSCYGAKWKVRLFSASGKVAYGMKLPEADFQAATHRLSFFIEEGSVLYDGSAVEAMGYTRQTGGIGTLDWHNAADLTFAGDSVEKGLWWLDFDTNIFWDEMDAQKYEQLQYSTVRNLYGLSAAFGIGLEDGVFITLNDVTKPLSAFGDDDIYVSINNQGANGTVRVRIGLNAGQLRVGSGFEGDKVSITFSNRFLLPDGTPLREENTFCCEIADYYAGGFLEAVPASAAGEYFSGTGSNPSSGNPLDKYEKLHLNFYIHTPWTDVNALRYDNLQDPATAKTKYGLSDAFLNNLYTRIFIGKDGAEMPLRAAIQTMKLQISLMYSTEDRVLLQLTINTSDLKAASYPFDFEENVFSIRFGDNTKSGSSLITNLFCLPNGTPVRAGSLARPVAELQKAPWLDRQTLSSYVTSYQSGSTLHINITSNGAWKYNVGVSFSDVLATYHGFSPAFINSLKNKLNLTIGSETKNLAAWGTGVADVDVFEQNGCWALRLKIKNNKATGKNLTISFEEGFVCPYGSPLVIPIKFVRESGNNWTGSTESGLYFPNRTVSILSNDKTPKPSFGLDIPASVLNGTGPYYIYGHVKLEGARAIDLSKDASAYIRLYYEDGSSVRIATLTADTNGWVKLSDLYGNQVALQKKAVQFGVHMNNMIGKFTIGDLIVADKNGNILYSMANDTTLYGVGDLQNVDDSDTATKWTCYNIDGSQEDIAFPIITRGDANYTPNRVIGITLPTGYSGAGDPFLYINQHNVNGSNTIHGVKYYVYGRIRANLTGKNASAAAAGRDPKIQLSSSDRSLSIQYATRDGEWVAMANPDGSPISFIGGRQGGAVALSTPLRSMGIATNNNMLNGKMVIYSDKVSAMTGNANLQVIVRGYYKVTDFTANAGATNPHYSIGTGADSAPITGTSIQGSWKAFTLLYTPAKGNLTFELWQATGGLYLAHVTIETVSGSRLYDMSNDPNLPQAQTYGVGSKDYSIWWFGYSSNVPFANNMTYSIGPVSASPSPAQYDRNIFKFELWYATGTIEIADLKIVRADTGYVVYNMATDAKFAASSSFTNPNGAIGNTWHSDSFAAGSDTFTVHIQNYGNITHADSEYLVPEFEESVG